MLHNFRKVRSIFFFQLNINDTKAVSYENISRYEGLKTRIKNSRYWQNSTRNKEKFMSIHNKNTQLLFLITFRCTKKLFQIWKLRRWNIEINLVYQRTNIRFGKNASSLEYRMEEQFQNLPIFWNFDSFWNWFFFLRIC